MRRGETYRAVARGQYVSYIAVTDVETTASGNVYTVTEVLFRDTRTPSICSVMLTDMEAASYTAIPFDFYDSAMIEAYTIIRDRIKTAVEEGDE